MDLKGKIAIVTGGGRDIGRACVLELAARGANVAINYMASSEGADSAVAEIKAAGGNAYGPQQSHYARLLPPPQARSCS